MKVELKVRDGGIISPARRQLLSTLWPAPSTMSLFCVKVSLKLRADAALTPIYASRLADTLLYLSKTTWLILTYCSTSASNSASGIILLRPGILDLYPLWVADLQGVVSSW